jgi:hypothetical protein
MRGLSRTPRGPAASGTHGPTSTPPQPNPYAVPRAQAEGTFRIYTQGNLLPVKEAVNAVEKQLGVKIGRARAHGPNHIDVQPRHEEDEKKLGDTCITIKGEEYRIGPTFPPEETNVVAVILDYVGERDYEKAREAFQAALSPGASYLTATRGSSMEGIPDFCERVYLRMDSGVRMCDVVPRRIKVGKKSCRTHWYNAGPICPRCDRRAHQGKCGSAPRPKRQGPARPVNRGEDRSPPTPPPLP